MQSHLVRIEVKHFHLKLNPFHFFLYVSSTGSGKLQEIHRLLSAWMLLDSISTKISRVDFYINFSNVNIPSDEWPGITAGAVVSLSESKYIEV